ncbi:MAG: carboxypeptidase regulatory-like domain-containing protein [Elusimicrobiota bacterium]
MIKKQKKVYSGTTLIELMIAVSLLAIMGVGFAGVFANVGKAIQFSKAKTLASNIAQEQMQILKQKSFDRVLVTTSAAYLTQFSPSIPYDPGYYPPETILEGNIRYTRYTYVQVAVENSGVIDLYGAIPNTGMKAITITVVWNQGSEAKYQQLRSVLGNIDTTQSNAIFSGAITTSTGGAIANALVTFAENFGWQDFSNSSGQYTINLSPGTYSMYVSAQGYFPSYRTVSIAANSTQTQDFTLAKMSSGTVRGTAWINNHLVISQIVGSTMNASGFCEEYVELFNPSTFTWTMADSFGTPVIDLVYQRYGDPGPSSFGLTYNTLTIGAGKYYLIANTTTINAGGVSRSADAYYSAPQPEGQIWVAGGGSCGGGGNADAIGLIYNDGTGNRVDVVGWDQSPRVPEAFETDGYDQVIGLQDGEQFVRKASTQGVSSTLGAAYDSGNNNVDIYGYTPIWIPPRNSSISGTVVSGVPAIGAYVSVGDGLSSVAQATSVGNPPAAEFILTEIATGSWTVYVTSSSRYTEISTITITSSGQTFYIPNSATTPSWPSSGHYAAILSSTATQGFISGSVKNPSGVAISPAITIRASGFSTTANTTNGNYFLSLDPGTYDVTANPNNLVGSYVSATTQTITIVAGTIENGINFVLSQGGKINGFITRDGINSLAGISVIASDSNGIVRAQEVSGSDGRFTMINLSTGVYTVETVLGSGESSSPVSSTKTVTAGSTIHAGTFTVTGAYGYIRGSVTASGQAINTGVLLIASTSTITGVPPTLSASTLTGASYYSTNSYEDGSYTLEVRGSTTTTYKVYGYYTTLVGNTPTVTSQSATGISVVAGQTVSGTNLSW